MAFETLNLSIFPAKLSANGVHREQFFLSCVLLEEAEPSSPPRKIPRGWAAQHIKDTSTYFSKSPGETYIGDIGKGSEKSGWGLHFFPFVPSTPGIVAEVVEA